jgi:predicted dehydrogenase
VQLVHSLLQEGKLGQPIALAFRRIGLPPGPSVGVDVIHDLAVHDIDVFGLLAGAAPRLVAATGSCSNALLESAELLLRANNVSGLVQVNWRTPVRIRDFTLTTDECCIEVNYTTQLVETVRTAERPEIVDFEAFQQHYAAPQRLRLDCASAEPLVGQLDAFLGEVETGETDSLLARAEDGLRALRLAASASQTIQCPGEGDAYGLVVAGSP